MAISNDYIYIKRERKRDRERFTEKLGVFEIFGADEKNFKRSLRHPWRERTQVAVGIRVQSFKSLSVFVIWYFLSTRWHESPRNLKAGLSGCGQYQSVLLPRWSQLTITCFPINANSCTCAYCFYLFFL